MSNPPLIGITTMRHSCSNYGEREVMGLSHAFVDSVRFQGGLPVLIPLGLSEVELAALFARLDGLILSGGGDVDPRHYGMAMTDKVAEVDYDRDRVELLLARWSVSQKKPLLAVCRGMQVLNVAMGGTLWQDIFSDLPQANRHTYYPGYPRNLRAHPIQVAEGSLLAELIEQPIIDVNSLHHQSCREIAPGLKVSAVAPDGVIEAAEIIDHPFGLAVQWHPEWMQDSVPMKNLFVALNRAASHR
jgi:putative glutamine amidotransferase